MKVVISQFLKTLKISKKDNIERPMCWEIECSVNYANIMQYKLWPYHHSDNKLSRLAWDCPRLATGNPMS